MAKASFILLAFQQVFSLFYFFYFHLLFLHFPLCQTLRVHSFKQLSELFIVAILFTFVYCEKRRGFFCALLFIKYKWVRGWKILCEARREPTHIHIWWRILPDWRAEELHSYLWKKGKRKTKKKKSKKEDDSFLVIFVRKKKKFELYFERFKICRSEGNQRAYIVLFQHTDEKDNE